MKKFHGKKNLHGIPWNSREFHERKKTSMDFHGIPCPKPRQNSMEFHGKSSMEFHGKFSMEFHVPNPDIIPWSSMENFPWNSMEFHGIPWGYFTRDPLLLVHAANHGCKNYPCSIALRADWKINRYHLARLVSSIGIDSHTTDILHQYSHILYTYTRGRL